MQSEEYGRLASPISPDAVEIGPNGATNAAWAPAEARSAQHGDATFSIGALTLDPARKSSSASAAAAAPAGQERRKSIDTKGAAAAAASSEKKVGWEPVSPGLVDQSPEVKATQKDRSYYGMQWPADAGVPAAGPSAAEPGAPPLGRRSSKAIELGFAVDGMEGNLSQLTGRQFKDLLKSAIRHSDLATVRRLMTAPLPKSVGIVQTFIRRHKHGFFSSLYPTYECFLEEPDRPFFLMSAKKRTKNKTSNYTISLLSIDVLSKSNSEAASTAEDPNYLGKLRSNFSGSEYVGFDAGINPKTLINATGSSGGHGSHRPSETKLQNVRQELCAIRYENNVLSRCPRKFKVIVPGMLREDPNKRIVCRPLVPSDSLVYQYEQLQKAEAHEQPVLQQEALVYEEVLALHNKEPVWEASINAWCLNFRGRANIASVKNFQLVNCKEDKLKHKQDSIVHLQFGKMEKDVFSMDVQYPLSLVQAFEISLAGLDTKLLCD